MHVAVRPPLAATALVGVGLLAAPAVAPMPDVHLPAVVQAAQTEAVDLLASSSVFELYEQVFRTAVDSIGSLSEDSALEDFVRQYVTNQIDTLTTLGDGLGATGGHIFDALTTQVPPLATAAIQQLAAGQVSDAVNSLLQIPLVAALPATDLLPALQTVLTRPLQSLVNIVNQFTSDPLGAQLLLSGFIAPLISTPAAAAVAFQNVLDAAGSLDPIAVANAIASAPAVIADGFLNGGYGPDLGALVAPGLTVKAGGLLSTTNLVFNPDGSFYVNTGGPIAALQQVFAKLAVAITPPVTKTAVATVPDTAAKTVTVDTVVAPEAEADTDASDAPAVTPVKARNDEAVASEDDAADTESEAATEDSATDSDEATSDDDTESLEDTKPDRTAAEDDADSVESDAKSTEATEKDGAESEKDTAKSDKSTDKSTDSGSGTDKDSGSAA